MGLSWWSLLKQFEFKCLWAKHSLPSLFYMHGLLFYFTCLDSRKLLNWRAVSRCCSNPLMLWMSFIHSDGYWTSLLPAHLLDMSEPKNCSPPGSSIHVIFQARILECVATSFSGGSSPFRDWTHVSCISCTWQAGSLLLSHLGSPIEHLLCAN